MSNSSQIPIHAADRLMAAIEQKRSPVCVGLDPVVDKLPLAMAQEASRDIDARSKKCTKDIGALCLYCRILIDAIAPHVPCVKFQSACFERHGPAAAGVMLATLVTHAKSHGLGVILDAKRGDIGVTAEHYAHAAFDSGGESPNQSPDWLTINSYLGEDGITPFLRPGHGAFALARTSNPGGDEIQNLELKQGGTVSHAVAGMIARIGSRHIGSGGYSSLGAVVGATKPQDAKRLREIMPQQIFLVPGYGAQGGGIEDVLPCFKSDGTGAIVTASRSVIYAFKKDDPKWMDSVADAAAKFAHEVGHAVGFR